MKGGFDMIYVVLLSLTIWGGVIALVVSLTTHVIPLLPVIIIWSALLLVEIAGCVIITNLPQKDYPKEEDNIEKYHLW